MTWELVVTKSAQKDLQKLPPKDRERVKAALVSMRENPFTGDIVRLKGQDQNAWRRRVGEHRILYFLFTAERLIVVTGNSPAHLNDLLSRPPRYSYRIASNGFTPAARRAGIQHANADTATSTVEATPNATGSRGLTSNNKLERA